MVTNQVSESTGEASGVEDVEWKGMDTVVSPDGHTLHILLAKRAGVEKQIEKIQKRAARKGLTPVSITWGKAYRPWTMQPEMVAGQRTGKSVRKYLDARIPMTIVGDAPKFNGWRFIAALQHLDGENIVRSLPSETIPETYRSRGPVCDHCKANRRRADTFLLAHDDARIMQVGSTCIADFLGSEDAHKLALAALYFAELAGAGEEGFGGGGGTTDAALEEYLPYVAWCVREHGWMSRTAAGDGGRATADEALHYLTDKDARKKAKVEISEADEAEAAAAIAWVEAITDEDIAKERGDFLHNIRAVARTGLVTGRTAGIAGAIIIAYQRAVGRERQRKERAARPELDAFIGTVGKRETWNVTLDFVTGYETGFGYTTVLKFRTDEGATLVWKASSVPTACKPAGAPLQRDEHGNATVIQAQGNVYQEITRADVGKRYAVKGTVKKHDVFQGKKQTLVARCSIDELVDAKEENKS